MKIIEQKFQLNYSYPVLFTRDIFNSQNDALKNLLVEGNENFKRKVLFVLDGGVANAQPELSKRIKNYLKNIPTVSMPSAPLIVKGGEAMKNDTSALKEVIAAINDQGIDRHSFVIAVGGGSVLDMVGFASAVSHRGIRHIRIPTTVLSQDDSGVGVKNGINYFGKKNFLGTFAPPRAVINDVSFLISLDDRNWISGIAEAVKVALIKDEDFFYWLETHSGDLVKRNEEAMLELVYRSAGLHLQHISSGDPFESGSSRPLDFGHWSAHKLEQISNFSVLHGEAVAMGIALDVIYSHKIGWLGKAEADRILSVIKSFNLAIFHPGLKKEELMEGITEFREHLGGNLTIMLLKGIGKGANIHSIDTQLMKQCISLLEEYQKENMEVLL